MIRHLGTIVIAITMMISVCLIGQWLDFDLRITAGWFSCLTYLGLNKKLK